MDILSLFITQEDSLKEFKFQTVDTKANKIDPLVPATAFQLQGCNKDATSYCTKT